MVLQTLQVVASTTPTFFSTFFAHFLLRKKSKHQELSYAEGLAIIRKFIEFASKHTEDLQIFTKQKVPAPTWVKIEEQFISDKWLEQAADILRAQLGPDGLEQIGGKRWWTIRDTPLRAEFIEMQKDRMRRRAAYKKAAEAAEESAPDRIMLYIHGGAYFFSSLDTHRYQIQRHARKFSGRAFAPAYRLAPQFPFPCGLQDSLASYLYLIEECHFEPESIIFSGDSAGAGMVLALLVVLRDQGLPLPSGASLLSPWVDLTHSFPSIVGDDSGDYIPAQGFHYRPSASWPPPPGDAIKLELDGEVRLVDQQIQQYCSNALVDHPLISLINQGSLGGLPPLCIIGGSTELLRDEMTYLAHKAADPQKFPPSDYLLSRYPSQKEHIDRWPATKVHLLMFDGCAHVTPTLSFTKPAKYMYRAAASFNLWSIKAAKHRKSRVAGRSKPSSRTNTFDVRKPAKRESTNVNATDEAAANSEPLPDSYDTESELSSDDETLDIPSHELITVTGIEPTFTNHMIRERVTANGRRRPMEPVEDMDCLSLSPNRIGVVSSHGPILRWLAKRADWDLKYAKKLERLRILKQADRALAEKNGFLTRDLHGERPPFGCIAGWYNEVVAQKSAKAQDATAARSNPAITIWSKIAQIDDSRTQSEEAVYKLARHLKETGFDPHVESQILDASENGMQDSPMSSREDLAAYAHQVKQKP